MNKFILKISLTALATALVTGSKTDERREMIQTEVGGETAGCTCRRGEAEIAGV